MAGNPTRLTKGELMVVALSEGGYPPTRVYWDDDWEAETAVWLPPPPIEVFERARSVTYAGENCFVVTPDIEQAWGTGIYLRMTGDPDVNGDFDD